MRVWIIALVAGLTFVVACQKAESPEPAATEAAEAAAPAAEAAAPAAEAAKPAAEAAKPAAAPAERLTGPVAKVNDVPIDKHVYKNALLDTCCDPPRAMYLGDLRGIPN